MPCDLIHAEIHATLTNGATVVATFGKNNHEDEGEGDKDKDTDKDRDKGKDKDEGKDHGTLAGRLVIVIWFDQLFAQALYCHISMYASTLDAARQVRVAIFLCVSILTPKTVR